MYAKIALFISFGLALAGSITAQTVNTVAGNSSWGRPFNMALDSAGNIYAADFDKHAVWKVDPQGNTKAIAGTLGMAGYSGDGMQATSATLRSPNGVAVAPDGTIYIADGGNNRIRKVALNGVITTFAGTGVAGFTGDGGPAASARINNPFTMLLDPKGVLYFVDYNNRRIRKIGTDGTITTFAGSGNPPNATAGNGSIATATDMLPGYLALASDGSMYYGDDGNLRSGVIRVRKIATNGMVTTVAGDGKSGYTGDGGPATAAELQSIEGLAFDSAGNLFICDYAGVRIRKVDKGGTITTYAGKGQGGSTGDGGPALSATFYYPTCLVEDSSDNLFVCDTGNLKIRKISPVPTPAISSAGIVPSFLGRTSFASNMFVEIYGTNLAATSRDWAGSDFNGSTAPTTLDGVSVTVNGKPAFIEHVSPGQVNINTPDDTAVGPVNIQVTNSFGVVSNVVAANRTRVSPALHTVPLFNVGGKQYVAAHTPDFSTFIGTPGMIPDVPFVAAKPGDVVIIFALGCGPTNPAVPAGTLAPQTSTLASPYTVLIGGVPAQVQAAVLLAGYVGLYQFNVMIPNVSPGDQTIELQVDGVSNAQNLWITVGQ